MKPSTVSLLAAVLALSWTGAAQAKELALFRACGAAGCKQITSPTLLRSLIRALEAQGEPVSARTPAPVPFYRFEFTAKGDEGSTPSFTQYYTRGPARIAMESNPGAWTWVEPRSLRALFDRVTAGVKPFAAPRVAQVTVGGRAVQDPASYARLLGLAKTTDDYPDSGDWTAISIETAESTPWSTGAATLEYSPSKNVLWRGAEFIRVPSAVAARLEARKSLAGATDGGSFPWLALGGMAIFVPVVLIFRRWRSG